MHCQCALSTSLPKLLYLTQDTECCCLQEAEVVALPRIIVKRWPQAGIDVSPPADCSQACP